MGLFGGGAEFFAAPRFVLGEVAFEPAHVRIALEVERVLDDHPDVLEAAVVGLPDERKGEVPVAAVRIAPAATFDADELMKWAAERLSDYKVPQQIVSVDEFPRTGTNKVQRKELLSLFTTT